MLLQGNAVDCLKLVKQPIHLCITSPPYWQQRHYTDCPTEIGIERLPQKYLANLINVFDKIKDMLTDDGSVWVNLGDKRRNGQLLGLPWQFAFAIKKAGWLLVQDIIWHKPNPRPESCTKRCTLAHEYFFHFVKNREYYFDTLANKEPATYAGRRRGSSMKNPNNKMEGKVYDTRNKRSVWTVQPDRNATSHTATFPMELIEHCILTCSKPGDNVLDPFVGSGTTVLAAEKWGRKGIGIDLDIFIAKQRLTSPSFLEWLK